MICKLLAASLFVTSTLVAETVIDWAAPSGIRAIDAAGQPVKNTEVITVEGVTFARLDGKTMFLKAESETGSQTWIIPVKFAAAPQGALLGRHRPGDGFRGFEAGLAADKFFVFDGPRPAAQLSGGGRDSGRGVTAPPAAALKPEVWYDVILRFESGKGLRLEVFEKGGKRVCRESIEAPGIASLAPNAGEKLLSIGGRRLHSRTAESFLPAGTLLGPIRGFDRVLSDVEIADVVGYRPVEEPVPASRAPVVYYVGNDGRDDNDGLSRGKAFATLQSAADRVVPGDTVLVAPGVYFERPRLSRGGTREKPVLFKALDCTPGRTIVTAASPPLRRGEAVWKLEDEALQLYSTPFTHNPARILYSDCDLYPYPSLEALKSFTLKNRTPGVENGFFFDPKAGRLYVRLRTDGRFGPSDPARHTIAAAPPNAPGFNGHHIGRPEEAVFFLPGQGECGVVLDGFTLETPGAAGVVTFGDGLVVRNVTFRGCRFGVAGVMRNGHAPGGVFVENCRMDSPNIFLEMRELIEKHKDAVFAIKPAIFWWQRKGVNNDPAVMKNYETGIAFGGGANWHIRDNQLYDLFEGMSCWGLNRSEGTQIYGNDFRRMIDNAIETENHNRNMRIMFNYFEDIFEPLSHQPLGGFPFPGPIFIYRNIVNRTPGAEKIWPHQAHHPGIFKIGATGRNWEHKHMGSVPVERLDSRISKKFFFVDYPGFLAFNNTFHSPGSNFLSTPQPIHGEAAREYVNFRFFNNIILADGFHVRPEWRGSLMEFYANAEIFSQAAPEHRGLAAGKEGITLDRLELKEFRLPESSPLRNRSRVTMEEPDAAADLGAIPFGFDWRLAAGPGKGAETFSPFQMKVRYEPTLIRTMGPIPGIWGVWLAEGSLPVELESAGATGAALILRFAGEAQRSKLLELPGLQLELEGEKLLVTSGNGAKGEISLPVLPAALWQTLECSWRGGTFTVSLNGKPLPGKVAVPAAGEAPLRVWIGRTPLFDVEIKR